MCHRRAPPRRWSPSGKSLAPRRRGGERAAEIKNLERSDLLGDGRLAVRDLIFVQHALAGGLIELLRGGREGGGRCGGIAAGDGFSRLANGGSDFTLHSFVALLRLLVGADALDLRLDVCHVVTFLFSEAGSARMMDGGRIGPTSTDPAAKSAPIGAHKPTTNDTRVTGVTAIDQVVARRSPRSPGSLRRTRSGDVR